MENIILFSISGRDDFAKGIISVANGCLDDKEKHTIFGDDSL
jgi:hypothetical protein